ncbi:MAG: ABC transporter permease, partial [Candidatus Aminicenantes bacterium]|nr:ABC transporter permease [Candidatus Aminicenantes bacterium]
EKSMLKNYLKIALRNIRRHKGYSFINLAGLSVGLAACILILIWVRDELNYDRFHTNIDHLYRALEHERMSDGDVITFPMFPTAFGPALKKDFPQVLETIRLRSSRGRIVRVEEHSFYEDGLLFADPPLLKVFSFPLESGNPETALLSPSSILLSEAMALKYFPDEDPIGRVIEVDGTHEFLVTGVIKNIPSQSHIRFDFVVPFTALEKYGWTMDDWGAYGIHTYVLLDSQTDVREFNKQIEGFLKKYDSEAIMTLSLQPLKDVHLHSAGISASGTNGDIRSVYVFSLIAFFILLMACMNFMNLTTARSENRAREVGLRKVVGAGRRNLLMQFFGESIFLSLIALIFAVALAQLALPSFNSLSGKVMSFPIFSQPVFFLSLLGIAVFTGLIAGSYPALLLSSFQPIRALRKRSASGTGGGVFRKVMVVSQFVLTICLIIGMVVVNRQMQFIRHKNLGIEKNHIVCVDLKGGLEDKYDMLKNELLAHIAVEMVTAASDVPAGNHRSFSLNEWEGRDTDAKYLMDLLSVDENYMRVFGLQLVEGRFFRENEKTDEELPIVINETAVRAMGMKDPIGKTIRNFRIIGVVRDFHFDSLHTAISPLAMVYAPVDFDCLLIKIHPGNPAQTLAGLEARWRGAAPGYPFDFRFLDDSIEDMYKNDRRIGTLINISTFLALFIACLGLFGMASFTAEQRTKEIGIRKVLGASTSSVFYLLSREFSWWVLAANVIAWPIAYVVMKKWLAGFAFKTPLNPLFFVFAAAVALTIALITVSYQTVRAALADPVSSLKHE